MTSDHDITTTEDMEQHLAQEKEHIVGLLACLRDDVDTEDGEDDDEEHPSMDVRLQVYPDGQWAVRWGDSSYDHDHRGYWGCSCLNGTETIEELRELAADLIEQALEHHAQIMGI